MSGPPPRRGECQFCKVTEAEVDGDKRSWINTRRDCCNSLPCMRALRAQEQRQAERADQYNRKCRAEARDRRRQDLVRRGLLKPKAGIQ